MGRLIRNRLPILSTFDTISWDFQGSLNRANTDLLRWQLFFSALTFGFILTILFCIVVCETFQFVFCVLDYAGS